MVKPEGRICYDVITNAKNDVYFVNNLPETSYADLDPNVNLFNLKTYLGHMVRCNGEPVGSLCVVFQQDYEYTETDRYIISLLALALEGEETLNRLGKAKTAIANYLILQLKAFLSVHPKALSPIPTTASADDRLSERRIGWRTIFRKYYLQRKVLQD